MLRKLEIDDISQMAPIHLENALEWSHNAQMGLEHIENIYKVILGSPESFGIGYFNDGRLASFITATTDFFPTMRNLHKLISAKNIGKLFKQVLRDPMEFCDMFEAKFILPRVIKKTGVNPHLLTWHNNFKEENCSTAALAVMRRILKELKGLGYDYATAQVDPNNPNPNRFYKAIRADLRYASRWNNIYIVPTSGRGKPKT